MINTIKYRLENDQEIFLLSLLSLISILAKIIAMIIYPSSSRAILFLGYQVFESLLALAPAVVLFLFILLQYKTSNKKFFIVTFILHCCIFSLDLLEHILYGYMGFTYLSNTIINGVFFICMLVFATKGIKNIKVAKIICIIQIVFTGFKALLNLINIFSRYSYLAQNGIFFNQFFSILFSCGASILFLVVVIKVIPFGIKINKNEMQTIQEVLKELKIGYENGILTEQEYNLKKTEILNKL